MPGMRTKAAARMRACPASVPYRAADYLKSDADRAASLEALLENGDARVITLGLRDLAESVGGVAALAVRAGLSRERLYRTLSPSGNPRLATLAALLLALRLRSSMSPASKTKARRTARA